MSHVRMRTTGDNRALTAALFYVRQAPAMIQHIVERDVQPAIQQSVERELVPYPPPIRPGDFKAMATPKQFRFVMAKISRGEWTGRTGGLGKRWIVRTIRFATGAAVETFNTSKIGKYVIGLRQQIYHRVTGWPVVQHHLPIQHRVGLTAFRQGLIRETRQRFRLKG